MWLLGPLAPVSSDDGNPSALRSQADVAENAGGDHPHRSPGPSDHGSTRRDHATARITISGARKFAVADTAREALASCADSDQIPLRGEMTRMGWAGRAPAPNGSQSACGLGR